MTLKEIINVTISSLVLVAFTVFAIKTEELCNHTSETLEKTIKIVDTIYNKLSAIENALNIVEKLPKVSSR